jgi:hypothetical protein
VLERKEQSSWVFFTKTRYSVTSASLQNAVRLQFARALEGAVNLTDRTAVLAAIASSSGVPQGIPASLWRLANTKAQAHEFGSAIMTLILAKRERERSSGAYSGWAD